MEPNLVKKVIPIPSDKAVFNAMSDAIPALHALGLTGINDVRIPGGVEWNLAFKAWQQIRMAGKLDLRCQISIPSEKMDEAIQLGLRSGFGDLYLRIGHVKFFADGGMGARTAWVIDPYLDADVGMPLFPMQDLEHDIQQAEKAGLAVMVHSIGDRANRELVTVFERIHENRKSSRQTEISATTIPHRIEHAQMIRPEDLQRLSRLPVDVCVQPHNMVLDINMINECVGERGKWTYTFQDMLNSGLRVLFSSDCPVCSPNPMVGIHAAVTRQRENGTPKEGWYPGQRVSVDEAIRAYTINPAMSYGLGDVIGSVIPGKRADLIVLNKNIYDIEAAEIIHTEIDMTLFDGRVVYNKS